MVVGFGSYLDSHLPWSIDYLCCDFNCRDCCVDFATSLTYKKECSVPEYYGKNGFKLSSVEMDEIEEQAKATVFGNVRDGMYDVVLDSISNPENMSQAMNYFHAGNDPNVVLLENIKFEITTIDDFSYLTVNLCRPPTSEEIRQRILEQREGLIQDKQRQYDEYLKLRDTFKQI
jgi:hypothetical protein